jgi:hypothetical protein
MEQSMRASLRLAALALCLFAFGADLAAAQDQPQPARQQRPSTFSPGELVQEGHRFFGTVSRGLAQVVEAAVNRWGQPNGYILGQEGGGAFIVGLRYGDGKLYTKNAGDRRVFWEGPSIGFDYGGDGARTMMLVYNLPATESIYQRFAGVDGSAYHREQLRGGADPLRRGLKARRQHRLSQVHATSDVEPVLTFPRLFKTSSCKHHEPGNRDAAPGLG